MEAAWLSLNSGQRERPFILNLYYMANDRRFLKITMKLYIPLLRVIQRIMKLSVARQIALTSIAAEAPVFKLSGIGRLDYG